jgi:hypothetical protein
LEVKDRKSAVVRSPAMRGDALAILVTLEAAAIALLGLLVAGLLRSHAEVLRALHDLGAGLEERHGHDHSGAVTPQREAATDAFDLVGTTPTEDPIAVAVAGARHGTLLAFLSTGCLTCAGFWEAFRDPRGLGLPDGVRLVAVTRGADEESQSQLRRVAPPDVPVVLSSAAWDDYQVPGSPYFVFVDGPSGAVTGEGSASSWPQVASLLRNALDDAAAHGGGPAKRRVLPSRWNTDAEREARADGELMAAGILPGDRRLYPSAVEEPAER